MPLNPIGFWAADDGPVVDALANGDTNITFGSDCWVGPLFKTSGLEYELTPAGADGSSVNTWLTSGSNSDVWVEFIRTGGTETQFVGLNNATRYRLSVERKFYLLDTSYAGSAMTIIGFFRFWNAASGGTNIDTTSGATWSCLSNSPV